MINRVILVSIIILTLVMVNVNAEQNNITIQDLKKEMDKLNDTINKLKLENNRLMSENIKLQKQINDYQNQINSLQKWDVRKLMGNLTIYQVTPQGIKYNLIFHVGGLGGVTVYQYVGPWMGDAGKWRQYKQIAFYKGVKGKTGYETPGLVLKPVWGFENESIQIRNLGDIIAIEKKYNSIYGLTLYFNWLRDNYIQSTRYNIAKVTGIMAIVVMFGVVFGERVRPITRLINRINMWVMTDFGDRKLNKRFMFMSMLITIILFIFSYTLTQSMIVTLVVLCIWGIIFLSIFRFVR